MSDEERREFYEGDVLVMRGAEYRVERVDITSEGKPLQYRLEPRGDYPPALLEPAGTDSFVLKQWYEVDPTVIE